MFPLVMSLGLVVALGAIGLVASAGANRTAQDIHQADRLTLQRTLGGLANQYFLFVAKDALDYAADQRWSLTVDDPADRARLRTFVEHSPVLSHGAALVSLTGAPLNSFARDPGLPAANDPGYQPLRALLLRRELGLSSVMRVEGVSVVALAVPVMDGDTPGALFVGFFRADTGALQTYNERLRYGKTGRAYLVDSAGGIVASSRRAEVGGRYDAAAVLERLRDEHDGFMTFARGSVRYIASYASVGVGGWGAITEQTEAEFFGRIASGGRTVMLALLALLIVAAGTVAVLNHKRQLALRKAYEYKGQLLANTTHELKTPLTAIRGSAMTLGMRWREMKPQQVDQFLSIIHRRCDALGKLIERILMGARLEAGREIMIAPEPIDVRGALRAIAAEFSEATTHHTIVVDAPDGLIVEVDPDAMDQILGLLVENAIKYSPEGGEIRIGAEGAPDEMVTVRVSDPGVGISAEDRGHVFEPYFKGSRGDGQHFAGVGLGLAIARHLVCLHGGDIHVSSQSGVGTLFSFTLPRGRAMAPDPAVAEVTT